MIAPARQRIHPAIPGDARRRAHDRLPEALGANCQAWRAAGGVTPHVLRHSFASLAGDIGYSEPTIAALVGHKGQTITSRYVHSADKVLLAAADDVANRMAALMGDSEPEAAVVPLRAAR